MRNAIVCCLVVLVGCGGSGAPDDQTPSVIVGEIGVRLSPDGINDFVLSGLFKSWPHKTEQRDARQDHKLATTYYNRILLEARGGVVFPTGAMAINEEDLDHDSITDGYSLAIKIDDAPEPAS